MQYALIIHRADEGGYWAEVPALDGCFAQAETIDDLLDDARRAILSHLEALAADGQSPPSDDTVLIATVNFDRSVARASGS